MNDLAVRVRPKIMEFLKQGTRDPLTFGKAKVQLLDLYATIEKENKAIEQQMRQSGQAGQTSKGKKN